MNKKEVIEEIEKEKSNFNAWEHSVRNRAFDDALAIVRKLDEPEKPVVPQYVADFYESIKDNFETKLYNYFIEFYNCWEDSNVDAINVEFDVDDVPVRLKIKATVRGYEA